MTTREVAIWEVGRGECWKVEGLNGYKLQAMVDRAVDAMRLVRLEDERVAILTGKQVVTEVRWHTRTGIGRTVVFGITGEWRTRE